MIRRMLIVAMLLAIAAGGEGRVMAQPEPAWDLFWQDEFDGLAGSLPDAANWSIETGNRETNGWGNQELQFYTADPANVSLDGEGHLLITARYAAADADLPCWHGGPCAYTSGRITTKGTVALWYGRAEARLQVPAGTGLWPAFWMLGTGAGGWPDQGEIDVMELIGSAPNTVYSALHGPGYTERSALQRAFSSAESFSAGFHTFAVEKRPGDIRWFVDDVEYFRLTPGDLPAGAAWVADRPFYLLLNLAVGGAWPGDPAADTPFPATLIVDYVRLYGTGTPPAG